MNASDRFQQALQCHARGEHAQAISICEELLRDDPRHAEALRITGASQRLLGRLDLAVDALQRGVQVLPDASMWAGLGVCLKEAGRPSEALPCFEQAVAVAPGSAQAHFDLGWFLWAVEGRLFEARRAFDRALALDPRHRGALINQGLVLGQCGEYAPARRSLERALELNPQDPQALYNMGLWHLLQGDLAAGWAGYRHRFEAKGVVRRVFEQPRWDGRQLPPGQALHVPVEQGLGDLLQFVRFLPQLRERAERVVLECPQALLGLVSRCPGGDALVPAHEPLVVGLPVAAHLPLLDVPLVLGTTLDSLPRAVPYLFADPCRVPIWAHRVARAGEGLRVGLAWAGNPGHEMDRFRSLALEALLPLAQVRGVRFLSLQTGARAAELQALQGRFPACDLAPWLADFDDTAAAMAHLDLVVTVDTSVAHLAGGMGIPTWLLLPYHPDWRWLLERADSPWYPSMRLFRQPAPGQWAAVVEDVVQALGAVASPPVEIGEAPCPAAPRVAIITPDPPYCTPLDEMGLRMLRAVVPAGVPFVEVPLHEVECLDATALELVMVGCGGPLPLLDPPPALARLLEGVPASVGLFGVDPVRGSARLSEVSPAKGRVEEPSGSGLPAVLGGLTAWFARTAEDLLLHGAGCPQSAWAGDWRVLAVPLASPGPLGAGEVDLFPGAFSSPDDFLWCLQSFGSVVSSQPDVLLAAMASATEVAWRGEGDATVQDQGARGLFLDVLGHFPGAGAWVSVDAAVVAGYRAQCAVAFAQVRQVLEALMPVASDVAPATPGAAAERQGSRADRGSAQGVATCHEEAAVGLVLPGGWRRAPWAAFVETLAVHLGRSRRCVVACRDQAELDTAHEAFGPSPPAHRCQEERDTAHEVFGPSPPAHHCQEERESAPQIPGVRPPASPAGLESAREGPGVGGVSVQLVDHEGLVALLGRCGLVLCATPEDAAFCAALGMRVFLVTTSREVPPGVARLDWLRDGIVLAERKLRSTRVDGEVEHTFGTADTRSLGSNVCSDVGESHPPLLARRAAAVAGVIPRGATVFLHGDGAECLQSCLPDGCTLLTGAGEHSPDLAVTLDLPVDDARGSAAMGALGAFRCSVVACCALGESAADGELLARLVNQAGLHIHDGTSLEDGSLLLQMDHSPPWRRQPCRVLLIAPPGTAGGGHGERLGVLRSLMPPHARIEQVDPWSPVVPEHSYDLVILGAGNCFGPSMLGEPSRRTRGVAERLLDLLVRAPRRLGVFGTQFPAHLDRGHVEQVVSRLSLWLARTRNDATLFGGGREHVSVLGDLALATSEPLRQGQEGHLHATHLTPLLRRLPGLRSFSWSDRRAPDGEPSGRFRAVLEDIFPHVVTEGQVMRVEQGALVQYQSRLRESLHGLREALEVLTTT